MGNGRQGKKKYWQFNTRFRGSDWFLCKKNTMDKQVTNKAIIFLLIFHMTFFSGFIKFDILNIGFDSMNYGRGIF